MAADSVSRRDILRTLGLGLAAGSVLRVIPAEAAALAHAMVAEEKGVSGAYVPKFFNAHQYKLLRTLCDTIIPADTESAGALEAGAPEFIDLLSSENPDFQVSLAGGMMWLDSACSDRYGSVYLDCTPTQQKEILDLIAFKRNSLFDPTLSQGNAFFAFLRSLTADGFFTSKIGIAYLGYVGNTYLLDFPGCPPVPET